MCRESERFFGFPPRISSDFGLVLARFVASSSPVFEVLEAHKGYRPKRPQLNGLAGHHYAASVNVPCIE